MAHYTHRPGTCQNAQVSEPKSVGQDAARISEESHRRYGDHPEAKW